MILKKLKNILSKWESKKEVRKEKLIDEIDTEWLRHYKYVTTSHLKTSDEFIYPDSPRPMMTEDIKFLMKKNDFRLINDFDNGFTFLVCYPIKKK